MPTIEQIRAARALLGWNQHDLANKAGLSQTGIARIENGTNQPNSKTIEKISKAFDEADIEFLGDAGLRKKSGEIKVFEGVDGFRQFMNDIYNTAREQGGEFCLHNAKPDNWYKWLGEDWFAMHSKRMSDLGDRVTFKITAEEGNTNLISSEFAEYRWFPAEQFDDQCIYAYGDRLAFVNFKEKDILVRMLQDKSFSEGFRVLFNIAWDSVAIKIPQD
ncbi:MAG: helix-turn-helix transcriptional regulator [Alphaproteobacteria bacterium]|nr:helix-turn-helix transcriptional regulator [Alphaproteobacteria bacterium]